MNYWLMKSEPDCYSIDDLKKDNVTHWDGVRNYQARNYMRDDMKVGDGVLYYHSNTKPPHIAGFAKVVKESYPDPTQFDASSKYFDEKATLENPRWFLVDIKFVSKGKDILSLDAIKADPKLEGILVAKRGMRLSVQPVEKKHFKHIEQVMLA